ncbi:MAG: acyl-ACP--UDP-N-acetylglucosamine O-acyltransferase [Campylobacteraceae bacterium]
MSIHKTAIIEDGAVLGADVKIGPNAYISSKSKIGDRCEIMQGARILGATTLGSDVRVYSYSIVGGDPQDVSFKVGEEISKVIIGDGTTIREFVTINGGSAKGDFTTRVGKNCFIMNFAHIAHDCILRDNIILANNATLAGHVEIGSGTVVGGLTPIHQFVKIGEGCMIAGASALSQDVPPYCLAEGNRANIRGLNLVGLRRHASKEDTLALQDAYRKIFKSNAPIKESAEELLQSTDSEKVKSFCQFILDTKRGIPFERS